MIVVKYEPYKNDITTVAYPVPKLKYKFQAISGLKGVNPFKYL